MSAQSLHVILGTTASPEARINLSGTGNELLQDINAYLTIEGTQSVKNKLSSAGNGTTATKSVTIVCIQQPIPVPETCYWLIRLG